MTAEEKRACHHNEYNKAWNKRNSEKVKEWARRYRKRNRERVNATALLWVKRNIEKSREIRRKSGNKVCASLTNSYIATVLGIGVKYLPKELIEAKREQLKLVRLLKEKNRVENSAG